MKGIKKFFFETMSSVVYMWIAVGCLFIAWLMMFAPAGYQTINPLIGQVVPATSIFFTNSSGTIQGAVPAFVGYMFVIVAMLALAVLALPFVQPSAKVEKIVLISSLVLEFVGLLMVSMILIEYCGLNGRIEFLKTCYLKGGTISFIVFDILAIGCTTMATVLDW